MVKDGIEYAMKICVPSDQDRAKVLSRAKAEFDIVAALNLNSVLKYHEFKEDAVWKKRNGQERRVCYLVMELVEGVELLEFIKEADV